MVKYEMASGSGIDACPLKAALQENNFLEPTLIIPFCATL